LKRRVARIIVSRQRRFSVNARYEHRGIVENARGLADAGRERAMGARPVIAVRRLAREIQPVAERLGQRRDVVRLASHRDVRVRAQRD
jgi:hypothetical protein